MKTASVDTMEMAMICPTTSGCSATSMGPGRRLWMVMAASRTAAGALPGHGQGQRRDDVAADAGVVAGFGGDEALDGALAEQLGRLAGRLAVK